MTKDELLEIADIKNQIDVQNGLIKNQEDEYYRLCDQRVHFCDTVMMSSHDEACRVVPSRVQTYGANKDEKRAKQELDSLNHEKEEMNARLDALIARAEAWIKTLPDWRIQKLLKARYIQGATIEAAAIIVKYSKRQTIRLEAQFWGEKSPS